MSEAFDRIISAKPVAFDLDCDTPESLLDALLDISKLDAGAFKPEKRPFALQPLQQRQHLLLHGHIQRTGGLVQHQQLRLDDEGARNGQALALAA